MKKTFLAAIMMATLPIACSAPSSDTAETSENADTSAAEANLVADLGGDPQGPVYTKNQGETLALSGYDPVSYFSGDAPVEGTKDYRVRYQGFDYQFANEENAKTFQAEPAKYAPQYGGYCAWAIGANDALAPGDPNVYKIVDGKLYLNFSEGVAEKWREDIPGFIENGDKNYPTHDASEHYTT